MIKIKKTIGPDHNVDLEDVHKVKGILNNLGYYEKPEYGMTPYPDKRMFDSISSFQKDENLKVDSIIKPNGETLEALNRRVNSNNDLPGVKGPFICPTCGGRHGGAFGDICQWCILK